jgi:3',5'-cyclic AMP phosphodiesterase CpdA
LRTIAHISDLHFGTEDPVLVEGIIGDLLGVAPDLVAVSGDLTQRARSRQFAAARAFLERIPFPKIVVPGNHDIPLFDVFRRFLLPLERYRRHITSDLAPLFEDSGIVVLGVNTARSLTWKNGRISREQMDGIRQSLCSRPDTLFKILLAHHPFIPPPDDPSPALVGRGLEALKVAEDCGADLVLAGHLHVGYTGDVRAHHLSIRRSILVAQAGTAISRRRRTEANSYNLVRIDPAAAGGCRVVFHVRAWDGARFAPSRTVAYQMRDQEWREVETAAEEAAAPQGKKR